MENYLEYGNEGVDCNGKEWHRIELPPKYKDRTNQKFNNLTALFPVNVEGKKEVYWLCLCKCGNLTCVNIKGTTSNIKTCGCSKKRGRLVDLTGLRQGIMTVLEYDNDYYNEHPELITKPPRWKCKCDCGTIFSAKGEYIRKGSVKSCGCLNRERFANIRFEDLTGKKFGHYTVLGLSGEKHKNNSRLWLCKCDCGAIRKNTAYDLTHGKAQSCGCVKSRGEETIARILTENNINFQKEYSITTYNFKETGGHPRFDFAIFNNDNSLSYLIEFQGKQHYYDTDKDYGYYSKENLKILKQHDIEKVDYCKLHNIPLIIINYDQLNNLNLNMIYFPELIH